LWQSTYYKKNSLLSSLQNILENYVKEAESSNLWRENAISLTKRYLKEGLQDRAVSGYYTASKQWAKETKNDDLSF
jgi:methionyl-tRNA synthetase